MEIKPFIVVDDQIYINGAFLESAGFNVTFDGGKHTKTVINISDKEGRIRIRITEDKD